MQWGVDRDRCQEVVSSVLVTQLFGADLPLPNSTSP